ncbi:response regulator [Candidatus Falkowbacteria bacterium]|nr:response regulator [Candidatus Falkowbacteria bacterium]
MIEAKKKILIVEDDAIINAMYKARFEIDGFAVLTAANGAEGLEAARKEKVDLVVLDVILPQLDGFAVLEELKKDPKTKEMPVIMLTSLGTDEDKEKGKTMGAIDYIIKDSLTPAQVSERIKEILK